MPAGKASIDFDGYELFVKFEPYRPDIVTELKKAIPEVFRKWNPTEKAWMISRLYRTEVETVFDVFEYAVRDYTGLDTEALRRQSRLKAEREARMSDLERAAAEEKAKADEATEQARAEPKEKTARQRTTKKPPKRDFSSSYGGASGQEEAWSVLQAYWRERFQIAWPECDEREFLMWWSWFSLYGREVANAKFNDYKGVKRPKARAHFRWESFWGAGGNSSQKQQKTIDHYRILGIVKTCTEAQAKAAYRKLAMKYHPDRNPGNAEALDMMKKINAAKDEIWIERGWKVEAESQQSVNV